MTTCGICVKANTWSYCEDMDLYAPGHVGSGRVFRSKKVKQGEISNGNRTEWSPIRSVIIRVITKSDDRAAGVRFVYHEYDYRLNWTTRSLITN